MSSQASARDGPADDRFAELSAILLGPERELVRELRRRVEDPELRAKDLAGVLAEAIRLRAAGDNKLRKALQPTIEESIAISVKKNPRMLADALFPIFGKAIRRAVAAELEAMMQSFSQVLEQSLSLRSLRWRLEALRTHRPYAEIVLLNSLLYRVEQVFLIHRGTGLLLQHAEGGASPLRDPDMVSGMLTAIQDFMRDSISGAEGADLESLRVGEFTAVLAYTPDLILAGFVRGIVPRQLNRLFQDVLETLREEQLPALASFQGDTTNFDSVRPHLEKCLVGQGAPSAKTRSGSLTAKVVVLGLIAILLIGSGTWWWLSARAESRWRDAVERLGAQPGIVITASGRRAGRYFIAGLRDPLAAEPEPLLRQAGIPSRDVVFQWEAYDSRWPRFVAERRYAAAREQVAKRVIRFPVGKSGLEPPQQFLLQILAQDIATLTEAAAACDRAVKVEVLGSTDPLGTEQLNATLARDRAANVQSALAALGVPPERLTARGQPKACSAEGEEARAQCRTASFRVLEGSR